MSAEQVSADEWFYSSYWMASPTPVRVTRETDKCVWIGSARHDKTTEYGCYRRTKAEVFDWLLARAIGERDNAMKVADQKQEFVDKIRAEMNR